MKLYLVTISYNYIDQKEKMRQTHSKFWRLEALSSVKSTDCLTFSISFLVVEMVKDEIQNSIGLCFYYSFVSFFFLVGVITSMI